MRLALASDHAGYILKDALLARLREAGHEAIDLGGGPERSDYPAAGASVGRAVAEGSAERGILVCGSGIGVSIAANKVPGIRAAVVNEPLSAKLAREHNDLNVLCLGERLIGSEMAWAIVEAFLATPHAGGRHAERVRQIAGLEASC